MSVPAVVASGDLLRCATSSSMTAALQCVRSSSHLLSPLPGACTTGSIAEAKSTGFSGD